VPLDQNPNLEPVPAGAGQGDLESRRQGEIVEMAPRDGQLASLSPPLLVSLSAVALAAEPWSRRVDDALATADRVGMLGGGRIIQSGTPDELYTRPGSRTVGLHFGRPPINLIDGRGDGATFISVDGRLRLPASHRGLITLGVRPEDVGFAGRDGFVRVGDGPVANVRRYDGRFLITVGGPDESIRGLSDDRPAETTDVWVRADRLHWFDPVTGDRLPGDTPG
jgi:hypothetical protein